MRRVRAAIFHVFFPAFKIIFVAALSLRRGPVGRIEAYKAKNAAMRCVKIIFGGSKTQGVQLC